MLLGCVLGVLAAAPADAVTITEFPSDGGQLPRYIHVGPDQNLWYTEVGTSAGAVGRISTAGERFSPIVDANKPVDLVTMPDGTVVWTTDTDWLGRRLPNGAVQSTTTHGPGYAIAATASGDLRWTSQGSCGAPGAGGVWNFLSGWGTGFGCHRPSDTIGRLTGLTLDSAGRLWTAAYEANVVSRMTAAADGFDLSPDLPVGSGPSRLAAGPDGNMWVTMYDASRIDRITAAGTRTPFPLAPGVGPNDIVEGPDGALWFTELKGDAIGRITLGGQVQQFALPPGSQPEGITTGPDGALWFTEPGTAKIGRLRLDPGQGGGGGGGGGGGLVDRVAPRFLAGATFTPRRFRVARAATPTTARARKPVPKGSRVSYSLSEPAGVTIVIARPRTGRSVGRTCRRLTRSNRRRRHCTYYTTVGTLRRRALQGLNRVAFSGRIGRRALAPGTYRATVTAKDAAGNTSRPSVASFAIVR